MVVVSFGVNPDGSTHDIVLAGASGHSSLDQMSLEFVRRCNVAGAPLKPLEGVHSVEIAFIPPADIRVKWDPQKN